MIHGHIVLTLLADLDILAFCCVERRLAADIWYKRLGPFGETIRSQGCVMKGDLVQDNEELLEKLIRIPALKGFSELDLRELLKMSQIRKYSAGSLIFEEGVQGRMVYYLITGKVKIVKEDKQLMILQRTGDVFGEIGALEGGVRSAAVHALDDTMCIELDLSTIDERAGDGVYIFRYMLFRGFAEILAHRLRITTEQMIRLHGELDEDQKEGRIQSA